LLAPAILGKQIQSSNRFLKTNSFYQWDSRNVLLILSIDLIYRVYRNAIIAALILEIQSIACCWISD